MNPRFPLTAKILICFSANLLLLMVIAWLGLRYLTRSGFDSFLAGHVGGRVEATARSIFADLETQPRSEWNGVLARYGESRGVKFLLVGEELQVLAGDAVDMPESIRHQLPRPPRPDAGGQNRRPSATVGSSVPVRGDVQLGGRGDAAVPAVDSEGVQAPAPGTKGDGKAAAPGTRPFTDASSCRRKTHAPTGSASWVRSARGRAAPAICAARCWRGRRLSVRAGFSSTIARGCWPARASRSFRGCSGCPSSAA